MRNRTRVFPDDAELVALVDAAQRGEEKAVEALFAKLRPAFVAFLAHYVSEDAAEDYAQRALIGVAHALPRIHAAGATPYLITVSRNLLRADWRQRARDAKRFAPAALAEAVESPRSLEHDTECRDLLAAVRRASLAKLSPELREVVLAMLEGLSPAEVATELRLSPITIRKRLRRARAQLSRELGIPLDTGVNRRGAGPKEFGSVP